MDPLVQHERVPVGAHVAALLALQTGILGVGSGLVPPQVLPVGEDEAALLALPLLYEALVLALDVSAQLVGLVVAVAAVLEEKI